MSFFQDFAAVLTPDIETALSMSSGECYVGRRQGQPFEGLRVWVERTPFEDVSGDGMQAVYLHSVDVHIVHRGTGDGLKTGVNQINTVEAHAQTLIDRYNGQQPLVLAGLLALRAEEIETDVDPDDAREVEAVVRIGCLF